MISSAVPCRMKDEDTVLPVLHLIRISAPGALHLILSVLFRFMLFSVVLYRMRTRMILPSTTKGKTKKKEPVR